MVKKGLFSDLACLAFLLLKISSSLFVIFLFYLTLSFLNSKVCYSAVRSPNQYVAQQLS